MLTAVAVQLQHDAQFWPGAVSDTGSQLFAVILPSTTDETVDIELLCWLSRQQVQRTLRGRANCQQQQLHGA